MPGERHDVVWSVLCCAAYLPRDIQTRFILLESGRPNVNFLAMELCLCRCLSSSVLRSSMSLSRKTASFAKVYALPLSSNTLGKWDMSQVL